MVIYTETTSIFRIMFVQLVVCFVFGLHTNQLSHDLSFIWMKQQSNKQYIVNCGINRGSYYLYVRIGSI